MQKLLLIVLGAVVAIANARQICYENGVGCFSDDPPFDNMPLPEDPRELEPQYLRIQRNKDPVVITHPDDLNLDKLIVMTHGFSGSYNSTYHWGSKIFRRILEIHQDADVLYIDWERGAEFGKGKMIYHQPASNVRVIAKLVAMWLQQSSSFNSTKVHCIGFSLGAHVCGMTAKRLETKWGRLSAIDPAGPAFIKDDPVARVDITDGEIVDVLHSSWVGLKRKIGHKDFFVNDANVQPGCLSRRKRHISQELMDKVMSAPNPTLYVSLDDIFDIFGCSHYRGAHLYGETIEKRNNCTFHFCPCKSQEHFNKGYCRTCPQNEGALLGYRSIETNNEGSFYGATTDTEPFCFQAKN